jgi:hypothetical protein
MMHWSTDTEIECAECEGTGKIMPQNWYTFKVARTCLDCKGTGYRAPTANELDNAAEAAYQRQFEGEPPMSQRERDEMQARRDAQWGVK